MMVIACHNFKGSVDMVKKTVKSFNKFHGFFSYTFLNEQNMPKIDIYYISISKLRVPLLKILVMPTSPIYENYVFSPFFSRLAFRPDEFPIMCSTEDLTNREAILYTNIILFSCKRGILRECTVCRESSDPSEKMF